MPELGISRDAFRVDNSRWWNRETERDTAAALTAAAQHVEMNDWRSRYMAYVCAQLMTGRGMPVAGGFGFAMSSASSRNAMSTAAAVFNPPALNGIATAADVFRNKVYNQRPFLQFIPRARNDFRARVQAIDLTTFIDAQFEWGGVWETVQECADDCMTFPAAWAKVGPGLDGVTEVTRVLDEELLFPLGDNGGFGMPRSMIQRCFLHKEDVMARFGEDDEKARGIEQAPGVFPGFYSIEGASYKDVITLCEGWRLPTPDGAPGRHVIAVGQTCLLDEEWTRPRFPFARLRFARLTNSWRGQSLAEQGMPLQKEIDRIAATIAEVQRREGWPRWLVEKSSKVNPRDLMGPGVVPYSMVAPQPISPQAAHPELYASLDSNVNRLFQRFGISANQAAGGLPEGLTSGRAVIAAVHVDDSRHVSSLQELEDFVTDIGNLSIEQNSIGKAPKLEAHGSSLNWQAVASAVKKLRVRAFPMSRLPTLPSAREQQIDDWYQDGTIDRATKVKLTRLPDTLGQANLIAAADDYVHKTLDDMIATGDYTPPSPFSNLPKAMEIAQARWLQESVNGLTDDRLGLISRYVAALMELAPSQPQGQPAQTTQPGQQPQPQQQPAAA